ncbi:MAG: zf-HC2 domain-containing protein [Candidatus Hydrogenedentes bacterium]|nr:zf-HC2 domain-containing protein [Candidatus Hydrogenedentota bacterium]
MHCEQVREKFVAYIDDDVRFTERICVEVHVARCFACKEELEELQNLQELCKTVVRHPGSAGNLEDLWRRIEEQEAAARSSRVWGAENWWNAATKLAAAAVVLFVLGVTSPFVREARTLAERFQQVTSESAEPIEVAPLLSAPFVAQKNRIESGFHMADHEGESEVSVPSDGRPRS